MTENPGWALHESIAIAENLEHVSDGVWRAKSQSPTSYPIDGHERFRSLEDTSFWFQHRNRCIVAAVRRFPPTGPLYDVGGGNGVVTQALRIAGIESVLVEPASDGVGNAQARGLQPIVWATLQDAGFRPATLPAVGLFDVVEHIQDEERFVEDVRRLLVPDGRLYVTVPAYDSLWSTEDEYAGHFRRYTIGRLTRLLEAAGFEVEYATHIFWFLPVPVALFRTLPSHLGFRTIPATTTSQAEHAIGGNIGRSLAHALLQPELALIRAGRRIPVGGSCLAVARTSRPR